MRSSQGKYYKYEVLSDSNNLKLLFNFAANSFMTSLQIPLYWLSMLDSLIVIYSIDNHKVTENQLLNQFFCVKLSYLNH